jgi:hypothetical protein
VKDLARKEQALRDAGYKYYFDRALYLNRKAKKAFSIEFIEDKPADELEQKIAEDAPGPGWHFFFTKEPSDAVQRELSRVLG